MLTTSRILLIRSLKLKVAWDCPLDELQTISLEPAGIQLVLRDGKNGPFLALPEQGARLWLFRHIEKVSSTFSVRI